MGIFDIDSGADNHLLNEQFHVFSKSPASVATALGDASNRSGHTVTASDVWGQEIPAFFYAKTQAVADSYKSLAKTNDLCRIGNSVAIFENGNWVVKYNSYTDILDGQKFKNAAGEDVIRFHKNRLARNLNLDNNAADDGLNTTAKIQGWDEENNKVYDYVATAPKFVTQFVTSTDKIVDGIPSKGFGPFVMAGTTTGDITKVLPEGTSDPNHYIANSFAGIIQFNKARTDAIYVHAFEYCGETVSDSIASVKDAVLQGVVASVTASDAAKNAGLTIGGSKNDPVINVSTGTVGGSSDAKLVTGSTVKSYVDTQIGNLSEEGGAIATLAGRVTSLESGKLSYQVVETLPTIDKAVVNVIYLVPETQEGQYVGHYAEWLCCMKDGAKYLEQIGTTATDLSGYATTEALGGVTSRVTTAEGKITTAEGKITALEGKMTTAEGEIDTLQTAVGTTLPNSIADAKKAGTDAQTAVTTLADGAVAANTAAIEDLEGLVGETSVSSQISGTSLSATGESTDKTVKVTLGGTVGTPTISVTATGLASADALSDVKTTADGAVQSVGKATSTENFVTLTVTDGTNATVGINDSALKTRITSIENAIGTGTEGTTLAGRLTAVESKANTNATNITTLTNTVNNATSGLPSKAAASDLTALAGRVTTAEGEIDALQSDIETKAAAADLTALTTRVTTAEGEIDDLQSDVAKKANAADIVTYTGTAPISVTGTGTSRTISVAAASTNTAGVNTHSGTSAIVANTDSSTNNSTAAATVASVAASLKTVNTSIADAKKAGTDAQADVDALATRVTTAEGKITTLNGDANTAGSVAKAAADALTSAKGYTDTEIGKLTGTGSGSLQSQITANTGAINTLKGVSLAKTSTQSAITTATTPTITVKTAGTIGTGLTGLNVEIGDVASAKLLSELTTKVNNHITDAAKLGIEVATANADGTPNVTTPSTNKIYIVQGTGVESNTYVEWIYVEVANTNGTEHKWERIGTTSADLTAYVLKSSLINENKSGNGITISQSAGNVTGVSVTSGEVKSGNTSVVTGGVVYTAIENAKTAAGTAAQNKIEALDKASHGAAGVTASQTDGIVTLSVTPATVSDAGAISANASNVVTATGAKNIADAAVNALDVTGSTAANNKGLAWSQTNGKVSIGLTTATVNTTTGEITNGGYLTTATDAKTITTAAINALDKSSGSNGVTLAQVDGLATLTVSPATSVSTSANVVTAGAVKTYVDTAAAKATTKVANSDTSATSLGYCRVSSSTGSDNSTTYTVDNDPRITVTKTQLGSPSAVEGDVITSGAVKFVDWSKVEVATSAFASNTSLTKFHADLDRLTTGTSMFSGCSSLTSFCGNLSSLAANGAANMFLGCKLDEESVIYIIDSLPTVTGGAITIGVNTSLVDATMKTAYGQEASAKGWTVTWN